ncbi:hypothetical protein LIER_37694 [Lithospermum erythrorhizon]|uniref:PB1 domain-containing protein n=1 Tax=Lithospermum erythrorhizon TaxID=34254 RepID=A0AAV3PUB3_LITER
MTSEGGSPRRRVKFLCSYGGKIVPRPGDAHLKYIGGETRVLSIPKHISFQDLMKRLSDLVDGEMILKYQLAGEELDALVSVKSDEDIRHMLEECDRCETAGGPRLRAFLFPAKPLVLENVSTEPQQRYIDAINGISRTPNIRQLPKSVNIASSACSSPRSPETCTIDGLINAADTVLPNSFKNCKTGMHKVHSSPSLSSLDSHQGSPKSHHRQQLNHGNQFSKPPLDPHRSGTPERLPSARSVNRVDGLKYQVDSVPQYYYQPSRHHRGIGGGYTAYMLPDDYGRPTYHRRVERAASPMSRVMRSPYIGTKVWGGHISGTTEFP